MPLPLQSPVHCDMAPLAGQKVVKERSFAIPCRSIVRQGHRYIYLATGVPISLWRPVDPVVGDPVQQDNDKMLYIGEVLSLASVYFEKGISEKSTFLAIFWGFLIFSGSPVL